MKKIFESFYLSRLTFVITALLSFGGWLAWSIFSLINAFSSETISYDYLKLMVFGVIFAVISLLLLISYKKGETNIQKMLLGSLLLFLTIDIIEVLFVYLSFKLTFLVIVSAVTVALLVAIFICHMVQQSDHVGNSLASVIGQACGLLIVVWLVFAVYMAVTKFGAPIDYIFTFAFISNVLFIVCIETRVNKYKQLRAEHRKNGTWDVLEREEGKKLFKL